MLAFCDIGMLPANKERFKKVHFERLENSRTFRNNVLLT